MYICIFHSFFLQLEHDLREIETSFFTASFYSEVNIFAFLTYVLETIFFGTIRT